ncbi:MAG: LamG domain-containing protein [Caldilineaceae bacterium]|nr:LamG domain-containing protein [Caldilineaceae bacterium]
MRQKRTRMRHFAWGVVTLLIGMMGIWAATQPISASRGQSTVPDNNRVTDGLAALYTFDEGNGAVVTDVSGVGDPLDLYIFDGRATDWGEGYLSVHHPTLITSAFPGTKIVDAAKSSNEITIEAWITPKYSKQDGPARIVTLSADPYNRNFTLGQTSSHRGGRFDVRLRTTITSDNGQPSVSTGSGSVSDELTHVVYTRRADGAVTIYINGVAVRIDSRAGSLSNWDADFRLALANEVSGRRPWLGDFHLVAIYGKALGVAEVMQNYRVGPEPDDTPPVDPTPTPLPGQRVSEGIQALYTFEEGEGAVVHDVSEVGKALDLYVFDAGRVTWGAGTLTVDERTILSSAFPAKKIVDAARDSDEITIEAWITPSDVNLDGPARIVSLSQNPHRRNFTLGQREGARYDVRLRTSETSRNGMPSLATAPGAVTTELTHVVYTRNANGTATIYLDGQPVAVKTIEGTLDDWSSWHRLALANEFSRNRAWLGTFHLVAIYGRALDGGEVSQNYAAGTRDGEPIDPVEPPPVPGSPAINGEVTVNLGPTNGEGAIHSTSQAVALAVDAGSTAGSITQMRWGLAEDALGDWVGYAPQLDATLADGDSEQRVFVQFRDSAGNISTVYSDTIILDRSQGADFGVSINEGAGWTNTTEVMLTLPAEARTAEMQVSNDGGFIGIPWEPYTLYKPWTVISYGTELIQPVVYVRYRNVDGSTSPVYQDDIILDLQAPTSQVTQTALGTSGLAEDDTVTPIVVSWGGDDNLSGVLWHDVQVKVGDNGEWTDWLVQTENSEAVYDAVQGEVYSFRVRSEDNAGNWSDFSTGEGVQTIEVPDSVEADYPIFLPGVSAD